MGRFKEGILFLQEKLDNINREYSKAIKSIQNFEDLLQEAEQKEMDIKSEITSLKESIMELEEAEVRDEQGTTI